MGVYEVIVVGAGPAAWATAIFLVRAGIKTLVIGQDEMSGLADASEVWNFPGLTEAVSGRTLLDRFIEQGTKQGAEFMHKEVTHVEKTSDGNFLVKGADLSEYKGKVLVLAHGANYIKANLPGEKELVGKGVHYCSLCDGPLYKGKSVIVLGNGNLAAEEALQLFAYAREVKMISQATDFGFSPEYAVALQEKGIAYERGRIKKIQKQEGALGIIMIDDGMQLADALFISLGIASSISFAQKLGLELNGDFVKVDEHMKTNVENVWAVGMARGGVNQIVKSVGDGGVAAVNIIKTIKGLPQYIDHT